MNAQETEFFGDTSDERNFTCSSKIQRTSISCLINLEGTSILSSNLYVDKQQYLGLALGNEMCVPMYPSKNCQGNVEPLLNISPRRAIEIFRVMAAADIHCENVRVSIRVDID